MKKFAYEITLLIVGMSLIFWGVQASLHAIAYTLGCIFIILAIIGALA